MPGFSSLTHNWRIWLLALTLLFAIFGLAFIGLSFGIDFKGGTSFQIHLAEPVTDAEQQDQIRSIIEQRLNFTGLRDVTVSFVGNDFVLADIAETDPEQVEQLESLLLRQGKFEALLDGNLLFSGEEFQVLKDPNRGYGLRSLPGGGTQWVLPFLLKTEAAQRFTEMTFHQCDISSVSPDGRRQYDCKNTFFFIDRPQESVLVLPRSVFVLDSEILEFGNTLADIPANLAIEDLLSNIGVPFVILEDRADQNNSTDQNNDAVWVQLDALVEENPTALIPEDLSDGFKLQLLNKGFELKPIIAPEGIPFAWQASGARSVISLTEGVTNLDPYIAEIENAKVYSELVIQGSGGTPEDAQARLAALTILLQSGSLPIAVENISKETISALLGQEFLKDAAFMGLFALIAVLIIIFIRYRKLFLALPIAVTIISEVVLILGFAAFVRWNLDLASVAGVLAAIGTGVDQQIIITDELLKGAAHEFHSLVARAKRAFFIVMASASTTMATMFPVILFGFGLGKLVGFATVTIVGVLIGTLITRPAFSEFAKVILSREKKEK
ncbi:hypothetical protein KKE06_02390 [Candidatus Micrarchaeota archaeon]|nr:hypothetical protein [Candidatus Micrarchaeota archaeon]MBU1930350.1 hypothetical protein [Candidatus Micrarchaeota archaeon]